MTRINSIRFVILRGLSVCLIGSLMLSSTPAATQTVLSLTTESYYGFLFWFHASRLPSLLQGRSLASQRKQEKQADRNLKVSRIRISPENATVDLSDHVIFAAVPYDADGDAVAGVKIKWSVQPAQSRHQIRISARGEVEATVSGSFNVIAEANGVTAQVTLTVRPGVRRDANSTPISVTPVSSRDVPPKQISSASTKKGVANGTSVVAKKGTRGVRQSHPVLPQGGGGGWNDTNYWSADEPGNGVGNPPGAAVDGGAGSANFQFAAPVISLSGRGINIALGLSYNSRLWNKANSEIDYDNDRGWPAPGFSLGFGKMLGMGVYHGAMLVDADGTRHAYSGSISAIYNGSHGVMHTTDGSFIDYEYTSGIGGVMTQAWAKLPNGTVIGYYAQGPGGLFPTGIEDANGNFITITYKNNTGPRIDTVTDTLGRAITFDYDSNNLLTAISAPGYISGTRTLVRLHYHQLSLNYAFSGLTASVRDSYPWVVDAIYYPATATGYWLNDSDSYSSYGMLAKVVEERNMNFSASSLNDMGTVSQGSITRSETYNYTLTADSSLTDAPTYTSMTESWSVDGSNFDQATTQYEVHENDTPRMTIITLPNGTTSKQYSYNHPGQFDDGLVYLDETRDSAGTLLQSSTSSWVSGAYDSPRPTRVEKTDERNQTTATEFSYGSVYNQVTEVRDYDYGGTALLRAKRTTYPNSSNYTNRHIFNLPSSVSVIANDYSTVVSRTDYAYDGQTLADTPGVVQHDETYNPYTTGTYEYCCDWEADENGFQYCAQYCSQSIFDPSTTYRGNLTSETSYADANAASGGVSETFTYDITGNIVTASTSCCEQTSFNYTVDAQYGYPLSKTHGSATDVYAQVTDSATYDLNTGLGRSTTDANGRQSTTDYDSASLRPTTVTSPTGSHTDYAYNDTAMTVTSTTYLTAGQSGIIAEENVKYLNGRAQIRMQAALGANGVWDYADTIYDAMGQTTQQSRPYRSDDTTKYFTTTAYDALGRTITVTAADNVSVSYTYYNESSRPDVASSAAGETTRIKDAWGRERWGRADASGRLVEVVEPNPNGDGSVASSGVVTTYAYDTLGNLITITQGAQTRSFAYDSLSRVTAQKLAEADATLNGSGTYVGSGSWSDVFTYDDRSNLTSRTDARGVKTNYTYNNDPLNRLQSVSWDTSGFGDSANPIASAASVSYSYRTKSSSTDVKDVTQISGVSTSGVSSESYDYDTDGRVYQKTLTMTGRSSYPFVTTYSFDTLDRITDVQYPAEYGNGSAPRKIVHHDFDIASRLTSLTYDSQTFASSIVYNAASQTTSLNVGTGANQIAETYTYGAATGFLDAQTVKRGTTTLLDLAYDYTSASGKRAGQLTKITNNQDSAKNRGYSYDALGRLVQATGGPSSAPMWTESYAYDRYGNRTSVSASGTSAKNRGLNPAAKDGSLVASQTSRAPEAGSVTKPPTPIVDLPTDLVARTIPVDRNDKSTARDGSQPIDDASRPLYKLSGNRNTEAAPPVGPPTFTDDPLVAGTTVVKALHVTELRDAINQLRLRAGLSTTSWAESVTSGTTVKASHVTEMRTHLEEARSALGLSATTYTDPSLTTGYTIKAAHIQELRDSLKAAWNSSSQIPRDGIASLTYDTTSNRITTSGFSYDKAGNQVRALIPGGSGSQRYKYDAANRMVQVLADNNTTVIASYTYGDSNERLVSDEGGYRTYYDCEGGATIAEYTEADNTSVPGWSKSYVYLATRLLSTLTPNGSGGDAIEFHHPDRLGTRVVSNPSTGTSYEQVTLPFGTALNAESTGSSNRRFTTYDRSVTTGLDYAHNRNYDSQQGRFTQVDPAGMRATCLERPQTLNLYSYVTNDPINQMDPTGLGFFSFLKKVFKFIAIAIAVALIVIAVVTLGQVALLTTLQYFLSAGSTLAYAFGKKKLGMILGALSFGLGAFASDHFSFGFEEAGRANKTAKILMAVGPIAAFLGDEPGPGMKRKRRRKKTEPHQPTVIPVIIVHPDDEPKPKKPKPTWSECFFKCTGSARDSDVSQNLCTTACFACADGAAPACVACAACMGVGLMVVEFCASNCCKLVGCPAAK